MDFLTIFDDKGNVIVQHKWTSPKTTSISDNGFGVEMFQKSLYSQEYTNTYNQIKLSIITTFVSIAKNKNYDLINAELDEGHI